MRRGGLLVSRLRMRLFERSFGKDGVGVVYTDAENDGFLELQLD